MRIPRYWARSQKEEVENDGRCYALELWGWSDASEDDAEQHANKRLQKVLAWIRQGRALDEYAYGERAVREAILEEISHEAGAPDLLTRNRYGALILNTERVLFIDIDFPSEGALGRLIRKLCGKPSIQEATLQATRKALASFSADGFRIYRTAAGLRVMGVSRSFRPNSSAVEKMMQACNADPAFVRLCAVQECFRARLTPKPWRCATPLPPGKHPRDAQMQAQLGDWIERYDTSSSNYATCRFIESVGSTRVAESVRPVLELHDRLTRAGESLDLA